MLSSLLLAAVMQFTPPVHIPMTLAGNFGEPRPNHFHGGIDIRTERVEGLPVFSIGEGYVSRITVGNGYGNALYIKHPNGKTSVYAHMQNFVPTLRVIVSRWRKSHGQEDEIDRVRYSSEFADIVLRPNEFPVSEGQLIGMSGNTGSSQAPHLHLEIHNTRNWAMIDPLIYFHGFMKDTQAPEANAFMAYPVEGEGVFEGFDEQHSFTFSSNHLEREFSAWGKVGFGIWANDYMDECYQKYGIRKTVLKVDGKVVFSTNVDSIPWAMNRYVNDWGDYDHYRENHVWYMKSFISPGNPLPILRADRNRGIVEFKQERVYVMEYSLEDAFGNVSKYSFKVHGKPQEIPAAVPPQPMNLLYWDRMNNYQLPGLQLIVRPGLLAEHTELVPNVEFREGDLSDGYVLRSKSTPLIRSAVISLRLKQDVEDRERLFIDCDGRNLGGEYHDGWVTTYTSDIGGTYSIGMKEDIM